MRTNCELERDLEGVSQKVLTDSLRQMEDDGLVFRHDYGENPLRVEYGLTELGRQMMPVVDSLARIVSERVYRLGMRPKTWCKRPSRPRPLWVFRFGWAIVCIAAPRSWECVVLMSKPAPFLAVVCPIGAFRSALRRS